MQYQTSRLIARNLHIAVAIVQFVYIYTPLHDVPHAIQGVQWVTFPLLLITGVWLRKGHMMWHAIAGRNAVVNR